MPPYLNSSFLSHHCCFVTWPLTIHRVGFGARPEFPSCVEVPDPSSVLCFLFADRLLCFPVLHTPPRSCGPDSGPSLSAEAVTVWGIGFP